MTTRRDILQEIDVQTDVNGDYVGDWVETNLVFGIRVIVNKMNSNAGHLYVEQANSDNGGTAGSVIYLDDFTAVGGQVFAEVLITARFFRIRLDNANAEVNVQIAVRAVSESGSHGLV